MKLLALSSIFCNHSNKKHLFSSHFLSSSKFSIFLNNEVLPVAGWCVGRIPLYVLLCCIMVDHDG